MENDLYPSIYDKAAQLCYGIANNHPFTDGNKRAALHSIYVYLIINGFDITATQQDVENMIIDVASGNGTYIGSHKLVHTCSIPNQTHI